MLLVVGPWVDLAVTARWVLGYEANVPALSCLAASCAVAVAVNISQFMCLGRFSAVTFQAGSPTAHARQHRAAASRGRQRGSPAHIIGPFRYFLSHTLRDSFAPPPLNCRPPSSLGAGPHQDGAGARRGLAVPG
jgi:hypothetical protein